MKRAAKTVKRAELSSLAMACGNEKRITRVILEGTVRNWIGFGWIDEGKPTPQQRKTLPRVID